MSQTINRMYGSLERAQQAAHELRTNRFDRFDEVHVVSDRDASGADASVDHIVAQLLKALVLKAHAEVFAEGIRRGGSLVTVHAPFGAAVAAIAILDGHGPIPSGVADPTDPPTPWDDAAPLSSALNLRVLLDDNDTFSRFWNLPVLVAGGTTTSSALGLPEISRSNGPFAGTFGIRLLSNNATILSSLLGLPVLLHPSGGKHRA